MPETVAYALLLQEVHIELEPVLKFVVRLLDDFGLGLLNLQVGPEVCGCLERIYDGVLESCLMIAQHTGPFDAAAESPKICPIVHECLLDELGLLFGREVNFGLHLEPCNLHSVSMEPIISFVSIVAFCLSSIAIVVFEKDGLPTFDVNLI